MTNIICHHWDCSVADVLFFMVSTKIVNSGILSNAWSEPPLTYYSEKEPIIHDHSEEVLIVVCDTLIDERSKLVRVALKDVELMP